ncbi:NAD(P)H-dependent oxidoreductase [Bacillaceae bacterium SIJ1]|uniref:NADPH-dependent FMN reductase n=1 Tax=Litoribacterium kuwaitense TaxID=1398745 RepID=UPI0013EC1FAA|nr:NAD(P)H-dependent oxidoreductase [Litoribacterium kuwaitense]NGP45637.1 NAD(P)H-dependent oxidoreductase [Litoribacterium kuwaitense]
MIKIGIITGSTRDARVNLQVAEWVKSIGDKRSDAQVEVVDIKDYQLPPYNEPMPALFSQGFKAPEAKAWSEKINELDGFVFVTPEYNRGITSALKDAIDYLYTEWNNKAAGIVSYGSSGGVTAAQSLRLILTVPQIATVGTQPALNLFTDFVEMTTFQPADFHEETVQTMLNQVVAWSTALKTIR